MKYLLLILALSLMTFSLYPYLDLEVSGYFYVEGEGFVYKKHPVLMFIYRLIYFLSYTISISLLVIANSKLLKKKFPDNKLVKKISNILTWPKVIFMLLVLIIGPGLIVHQFFKPTWERSRPVNITEFGGEKRYTPPLVIGHQEGQKSFVSGHSAMGFYMVSFAFLAAGRRRKKLYAAGITFGIITASARVMQGAHFLSDVIFGGLVTLITMHLLARVILKNKNQKIND